MRKDKVLCLVETNWTNLSEEDLWIQDEPTTRWSVKKEEVTPLINHPHSDKENGQKEVHYHADTRYYNGTKNLRVALPLKPNQKLEFRWLYKVAEEMLYRTPVSLTSKSTLKHQCIHKGKCPHRGYDLTNVEPIDGVITCPLHSLRFNATTKQLIK